jgi:hypothetical protein
MCGTIINMCGTIINMCITTISMCGTIINIRFLDVKLSILQRLAEEHLFRFSMKKILFAKEISRRRKYEEHKQVVVGFAVAKEE